MSDPPSTAPPRIQATIQFEQDSGLPYAHADYVNASWMGATVGLTFFQVDYYALGVAIDKARLASQGAAVGPARVVTRVVLGREQFVAALREMLASAKQMGIATEGLLGEPPQIGGDDE